jgi:hypothetical protein
MADPETEGIIMIGEIGGNLKRWLLNGLKTMEQNLLLDSSLVKLHQKDVQWVTQVQLLVEKMTRQKLKNVS